MIEIHNSSQINKENDSNHLTTNNWNQHVPGLDIVIKISNSQRVT
jgi:undecaprenyl pyrophosphate synthase